MKMSQPGLAVAVVPAKAWDMRVKHRCSGLPRTFGLLKLALLSGRLKGKMKDKCRLTALPLLKPVQECLPVSCKWILKARMQKDIT